MNRKNIEQAIRLVNDYDHLETKIIVLEELLNNLEKHDHFTMVLFGLDLDQTFTRSDIKKLTLAKIEVLKIDLIEINKKIDAL